MRFAWASCQSISYQPSPALKRAAGGAPANVAVGLARLGASCGFIGKVGDDPFGHFLAHALSDGGVDVDPLVFSTQARTPATLWFDQFDQRAIA